MIAPHANPFLDPRAADSLNGKEYVRCFSPYLVNFLPEIFSQGNVILRGTIGCGKSMMLRLLDHKVRLAYHESQQEFPVTESQRRFISTGINLSKSGILDIVQRMPSSATAEDVQRLAATFADYLNYWLVDDLLESCDLMLHHSDCFGDIINRSRMGKFVQQLSGLDCWVGYLSSCKSIEEVRLRINARLNELRSWANWNIDTLPKDIEQSKAAIGEPVAGTVACMKKSGLLHEETRAFVRIDQVEELLHKDPPQYRLTEEFRRQIYRALGRRDGRVSYRIGTRSYDNENFAMPGGRVLEESRDYVMLDFDSILRRGENPKDWVFKGFAEDVFNRRLTAAFVDDPLPSSSSRSLCRQFFGASPSPQEMAEHIIVEQSTPLESLVDLSKLPPRWQKYLHAVYNCKTGLSEVSKSGYKIDPLNASLAFAWALQNGGRSNQQPRFATSAPPLLSQKAPWTRWWKKERVRQSLLQLAASHNQRLVWWGTEHVLALSSNNITLFLSICRETWELWQRDLRNTKQATSLDTVPSTVQFVAIENISKRWHQNLAKQPGRPGGDIRIRFLDRIFSDLRIKLRKDEAMRYPGANGFSVLVDELATQPDLNKLLDECVAWGDLERVGHTSKHGADGGRRCKFYVNSILAPYYQIFEAHTKEPRYIRAQELLGHASSAKALPHAPEPTENGWEQFEFNLE